jgi:hypothetical protein
MGESRGWRIFDRVFLVATAVGTAVGSWFAYAAWKDQHPRPPGTISAGASLTMTPPWWVLALLVLGFTGLLTSWLGKRGATPPAISERVPAPSDIPRGPIVRGHNDLPFVLTELWALGNALLTEYRDTGMQETVFDPRMVAWMNNVTAVLRPRGSAGDDVAFQHATYAHEGNARGLRIAALEAKLRALSEIRDREALKWCS